MLRPCRGLLVPPLALVAALVVAPAAPAAVTVNVAGDAVTIIDSTSGTIANTVAVSCPAANLVVTVNSSPTAYGTCTSYRTVTIRMDRGNDTVDLSGLDTLATPTPGLPVTIDVEISKPKSPFVPDSSTDVNTFTGGPLAEIVRATGSDTITTAGGDDTVHAPPSGSVDGGSGAGDSIVFVGRPYGSQSSRTVLTNTSVVWSSGTFGTTDNTLPIAGIETARLVGGTTTTGSAALNDTFVASGFSGRTDIDGGGGDDFAELGHAGDVDLGDGTDTARLPAGNTVFEYATPNVTGDHPRTLAATEKVQWSGTAGDDTFDGTKCGCIADIDGLAGNDTLQGAYSDATVRGGEGDDTLTLGGGTGNALAGGPGTDTLVALVLANPVTLTPTGIGSASVVEIESASLRTGLGDDVIDTTAFPGPVTIDANAGNDTIRTGPSNDTVFGRDGDDTLFGSPGNDTFHGEAGTDTMSYAGAIPVTIDLAGGRSGAIDESDTLIGVEVGVGSSGRDVLLGSDGPDTLLGGGSADLLDGRGGPDVLNGEAGADKLDPGPGGAGDGDALIGGTGFDTVSYAKRTTSVRVTVDDKPDDGGAGEGDNVTTSIESVIGGSGDDVLVGQQGTLTDRPKGLRILFGGAGRDTVRGTVGKDLLGGGAGNDVLEGGPGDDVTIGGSGADKDMGGEGDDRDYPKAGPDVSEGGPGDDTTNTIDKDKDVVDCSTGDDQGYQGAGDELESNCDSVAGTTATPSAPGVNLDGTGCDALSDPACAFGGSGDLAGPDRDGNGIPDIEEGLVNGYGFSDEGLSGFTEEGFGDFDELGFGDGSFDDLGDLSGDDFGGKDPEGAKATNRTLALTGATFPVTVRCPKSLDRRCIGEVTITLPSATKPRDLGSKTFSVKTGKRLALKIRVSPRLRASFRRAKAKRLEVTLEGRDRGSTLFQSTTSLKVATAKKKSKRKR